MKKSSVFGLVLVATLSLGGFTSAANAQSMSFEGLEGTLAFSQPSGDYVTPFGTLPTEFDFNDVGLGATFATADDLTSGGRWLFTPYLKWVLNGNENIANGGYRTDRADGFLNQRQLGLRAEREVLLSDSISLTGGLHLSYVDQEQRLIDSVGNYFDREQEGWNHGISVGLNAAINERTTFISRIGYEWYDLNESYECSSVGGGPCTVLGGEDDDDTDVEDVFLEVGIRVSF
ncbi:MAG: hypothetical protein KJP02_08610 [Octadecabacter sp.]|nr:hypothetical protein [Octadecabacter sp.]